MPARIPIKPPTRRWNGTTTRGADWRPSVNRATKSRRAAPGWSTASSLKWPVRASTPMRVADAPGQIDARLRRFDLATGDSIANFKTLVRDVAEAGWGTRIGVVLGAIWSYRSQRRLLLAGIVLLIVAFVVAQAATPRAIDWLRGVGSPLTFAADWLAAHAGLVSYVAIALVALGALALIVNLARALFFAAMLFRGARLLNADVGERRRDLDAASARLNRRILALTAETEAAARRAEAAEKRTNARGEAMAARANAAVRGAGAGRRGRGAGLSGGPRQAHGRPAAAGSARAGSAAVSARHRRPSSRRDVLLRIPPRRRKDCS